MKSLDLSQIESLLKNITDRLHTKMPKPAGKRASELIDLVRLLSTSADEELRIYLKTLYPDFGWRNTELGNAALKQTSHESTYWIYDPIDGAYHFVQGMPMWSSSLALIHNGETIRSFVYDPATKEMFSAGLGDGAYLNGIALHPISKAMLSDAVVATALPPYQNQAAHEYRKTLASLQSIGPEVFIVRMMAAASLQLAYVAAGRLDAFWEYGSDVDDWLAGALLVNESGVKVTDSHGEVFCLTSGGIIATHPNLYDAFSKAIASPSNDQPI
ncbi:inositol monophosphatase family protein [Undibacterium sp. SXout20W]|uniref:inositol monophosphatase family protein n=1 Tax=Undibacterium sp. SXout20W TaxID=3413051 RepID=UPI003BF264E9